MSMPDPEPYFDPYTAFQSLSPKRAPVSSTGRRLPITPGQASTVAVSYNRPPLPGLPSGQRPSTFPSPTYSNPNIHSPYPPEKAANSLENGESIREQTPFVSRMSLGSESTFDPPQVNVDSPSDDIKMVDNGRYYSHSQPSVQNRVPSYGHSSLRSFVTSPSSSSKDYFPPQPEIASLGRPSSLTPCEHHISYILCSIDSYYTRW